MSATAAFDLDEAVAVLERTPRVLRELLLGLPEAWIRADEGPGTWSPFDVVGHFVHGEKTDWIPRARIILEHGDTRPFESFDRRGHEAWWDGWTLERLLEEMARLRAANLAELRAMRLDDAALDRPGLHPELGLVTMRQLLATWVAHDLHHLCQIERAMAKRYGPEMGPWAEFVQLVRQ